MSEAIIIIIILQVWCSLKSLHVHMYSGLGYSSYHIGEPSLISKLLLPCVYDTMTREVLLYIGGRGLVSQIIEPVTFARCAFIIALRNIALDGYLDTRRNCAGTRLYR